MRMRLSIKRSLLYMEGSGYPMSQATYMRIKSWLKRTTLERLHYIAGFGFEDQHLERIDNVDLIHELMWENYHLERSPSKKVMILKEIKELQPYISSYYEATKEVIKPSGGREDPSLPENTTPAATTNEWV